MNGSVFVDTNILVYAYDVEAGFKRDTAMAMVEKLWLDKTGILSTQVLQEFYVNVTQKVARPLSRATARGILEDYRHWRVVRNGPDTLLSASAIEERNKLSFWDSLIIAAAVHANAEKILTEDLNHGQIIEGIVIENPFVSSTPY